MIDGLTYMDAIHDLIRTKYKSFSMESLDESCSYTIALRHSKYHIFDEAKHLSSRTKVSSAHLNSYITIMCVADLKTGRYVSKNVHGLPYQSPLVLKASKLQDDTDQNDRSGKSIHTLRSYARSAYEKYEKAYQLKQFKYKPLYGYILRAKNRSVPNEYSTIYIESELYRAIKIALYKDNSLLRSMKYNELVVRMAINTSRYPQFQVLFPQFSKAFIKLNRVMSSVAMETVRRLGGLKDEEENVNTEAMQNSVVASMVDELSAGFQDGLDITTGLVKDAMFRRDMVPYLNQILC